MRATSRVLLTGVLAALALSSGCNKERPQRPAASPLPPSQPELPSPSLDAPSTASQSPPQTPAASPSLPPARPSSASRAVQELSVADFEDILKAVAPCEITSRGISRECEPYQTYRTAKRRRGPIERPWREVDRELATRLLSHQDAAVRFVAAELMGPMQHASQDQLKPLIEATRREVHPGVVKSFVKRLGPSTYRNAEVRELMMVLGGHLDERVRLEVGNWLTAAQGLGTPGLLERAMRMVREDPSERVRLRVLDDLGDSGDERVLPFLETFLSDAQKSARAHASAVRALINMWSSPIPKTTPSRAAYRRTLKLLKATPRHDDSPPWAAIGGLRWVTEPRFLARAEWFDRAALIGALEALIVDVQAGPKARKAAVELLIRYQEPPARFASLLKRCEAQKGDLEASRAVMELLRSALDPEATKLPSPGTQGPPKGIKLPPMPKLPPLKAP